MKLDAIVDAAAEKIKQIISDFSGSCDTSTLTPELADRMSECLSDALAQAGQAAFRAFLAQYDMDADIVRDSQGEMFRLKGKRNRKFMTPFGTINVQRSFYQNKSDTKSYVPMDAAWGMEGQYLTRHVREAVLFACSLVTPAEAVHLFRKCAFFHPDSSTVKREVERTGKLMELHRHELDQRIREQESVPEGTKALVVSIDGANVLMNEKGVHFGRPAQRPGGDDCTEKPTAYRIAMVGSISHYGGLQAPGQGPERLQSRYLAQMPELGWPTFKTLLEGEVDDAEARLPADLARILLLDGSRQLWNYFDKDPRYDGYHRCIDFWHAMEHLSVAAEALFPHTPEKAKAWYTKYGRLLMESDNAVQRILRSIDYHAPRNKRSKTSEKHLKEEKTYFKRNAQLMKYATFRANAWPIGSGPIEAACKTLVKTRMCRSGMRWTRPGGQYILSLRTYVKSDRWDQAWNYIKTLDCAA